MKFQPEVKNQVNNMFEVHGLKYLYNFLKKVDNESAAKNTL